MKCSEFRKQKKVTLQDWPTVLKPVYLSKWQYQRPWRNTLQY
jgi:hypothetical protein